MKKLQLNKKTIASLSRDVLQSVKGGDQSGPPCFSNDCPPSSGITYTDVVCGGGDPISDGLTHCYNSAFCMSE